MRPLNRTAIIFGLSWFLLTEPIVLAGDLFQWTDATGVLHFTDDVTVIPEVFRQSSHFTVRKNFFSPAPASAVKPWITDPLPPAKPQLTETFNGFTNEPAETFVTDSPEEPTIIVVNSITQGPAKKFCHDSSSCKPGSRRNFTHSRPIHRPIVHGNYRH
jgi:hypothetical protein